MQGSGFLAIWSDLSPDDETDWAHWMMREHAIERLGVDGFPGPRQRPGAFGLAAAGALNLLVQIGARQRKGIRAKIHCHAAGGRHAVAQGAAGALRA